MALNKSVFKQRALTALIFVIVMLSGLLINSYTFFVLISIIHFGAWWEYFNLLDKIHKSTTPVFTKIGFAFLGYGLLLWASTNIFQLSNLHLLGNSYMFFAIAGFALSAIGIFKSIKISIPYFIYAIIGFAYISLSCGLLIHLSSILHYKSSVVPLWSNYIILPCFVISCMWINDTMAYLVGSFIGKTPLSKISPKKTWEGTIGGVILCGLIVGFAMFKIDNAYYFEINLFTWIGVASVAAVLGTIGDLVESKLKRMADVKDSGNFMPGHGGFLDRFDSLLFATPFMWLLIILVK
jgi:phosphatidate cytidylyltransferase